MKRYISLPIEKLVSDVAVDPVHVRELADSIKVSGPISPVLIREENLTLIDGFHRVAAMRELGFQNVECILTPCDDETFWDLRIMSATLHKAVTFARSVDWIEEAFKASALAKNYKSVYSLFREARNPNIPKEALEWVSSKAQKWGLSIQTIENWLYTKKSLATELYEEIKTASPEKQLSTRHYIEVAHYLPDKPELQKAVIEKAKKQELTSPEVREVATAIKKAADDEEIKSILKQPISRTAEQMVKEAKIEKLLSQPRKQIDIPLPQGKYRTVIIDPPWPIEKILREVRPNQVLLDYPTMTIEEIKALPVPELAYEDGCHIYLWTTHKYLPRAFEVLDAWGADYECLLTWVKNVGITPFSWMYSTEHCLFARIGNLPLLKLGKRLDFEAKVREHSRKPDEFYNLIKEVSPEPRIDMFSREKREGFAQYGNELDRFRFKQESVID